MSLTRHNHIQTNILVPETQQHGLTDPFGYRGKDVVLYICKRAFSYYRSVLLHLQIINIYVVKCLEKMLRNN